MVKRKKRDDGDDDDWEPDKPMKPIAKNANLLAALAKKAASKGKVDIRCNICGKRCTDRTQLKNHRKKMHGSYSFTM